MGSAIKGIAIGSFFIGYPFLSAYLTNLGFASLELIVFAGLTVWRAFHFDRLAMRLVSLAFAALLLLGAYLANAYFVWLVPSFAYLSLAVLFGHTLWSPPSLLERLVRLQFPEFKPGIAEYLYRLTGVWTLFFLINVVICALLPVLAGQQVWAIYTGVIVYGLMGVLGIGEWFYRHYRFPDLAIPPAAETFKFMLANGHKVFKGME